jgi:hypothetical protein
MKTHRLKSVPIQRPAFLLLIGVTLCILAASAQADVPLLISYQARLTDPAGDALNGAFAVYFAIYDSPTSATPLWTEAYETPRIDVINGVVSVLLGSQEPFPSTLFTIDPLYLGVQIANDEEIQPRRRIVSSAFAINSMMLNGKRTTDFEPAGAIATHNSDPSAHPNLSVDASRVSGVLAEGQIPPSITRDSELQAHTQDFDNPHHVNLTQAAGETSHMILLATGTYTHDQIDAHIDSRQNPHGTRADQLVCPAGLVDASAYCIEIQKRAATDWFTAARICREAGLRLCTPMEWCAACAAAADLGLKNMNTDWEWLDNWTAFTEGTLNVYRPLAVGFPDCEKFTSFTASRLTQYRCCQ